MTPDAEDWRDWRRHPCTVEFLRELAARRTGALEQTAKHAGAGEDQAAHVAAGEVKCLAWVAQAVRSKGERNDGPST